MISLGVLTSTVSRDAVDDAVAQCGRGAQRSGGALPPHVMVYFTMAMALFADEDYEGVFEHLAGALVSFGGWGSQWQTPTSGGIAKARARLGFEPVKQVFEQVAVPVAEPETPGGFAAGRRLVSVDSMVFDLPDTPGNDAAFGRPRAGAFPQARVTTLIESGSRCAIGAHIGAVAGKGTGERAAAWELFDGLTAEMLLVADRGFYSFDLWCDAEDSGAGLAWRIGDTMDLPQVADLGDGTYTCLVFDPRVRAAERERLLAAARDGQVLHGHRDRCRLVRAVEYYIDGRGSRADKELICVITNLLDPAAAGAGEIAHAYGDRWEHEGANDQIKTELRGPGRVLRSQTPDMARAEIYGYLLTHYAIAALICQAATATDLDPGRIKFTRTVRLIRNHITGSPDFSP
jgi:hypothetical protein